MLSINLELQEEGIDVENNKYNHSNNGIISNGFIGIEKRRSIRKPVRWKIEGQLSNGKNFCAVTENVSVSGMNIVTEDLQIENSEVMLKVKTYISGQDFSFNIVAEIKHVFLSKNMYHCGIEFNKISRIAQDFIRDFVSNKDPHEMQKRRSRISKEADNLAKS